MNHRMLLAWAAATALSVASAAYAADAPHDSHGGEPKSPLLSFDPGTAVWSIIVFVLLLVVLKKTAWTPILNGLQAREKFINESLANARREREEAEKLLKQYTERIEQARLEATAIVEEGKRDAEAVKRRIEDDSKKAADDMLARAKKDIAVARDDAIKGLYERTLDLASDVAAKIVRKQLTPADHKALLDESLSEMAKAQG